MKITEKQIRKIIREEILRDSRYSGYYGDPEGAQSASRSHSRHLRDKYSGYGQRDIGHGRGLEDWDEGDEIALMSPDGEISYFDPSAIESMLAKGWTEV